MLRFLVPSLFLLAACQVQSSRSTVKSTAAPVRFSVGVGKADITGPAAGLATLGYAAPVPTTSGIQQRLWARSFYFANADGDEFVYVLTDLCFVTQAVKMQVAEMISERTGGRLGVDNIMISATHTHSAPGAISHHRYYNIPSRGFSAENFKIVTSGIFNSIAEAVDSAAPGIVSLARGKLSGAGINRSLLAYLENPADERARYGSATDETTTLISLTDLKGELLGLIHFFAVHATAVEKDNGLITGDNKGYAAQRMESYFRDQGRDVVAAFANSAAGDVSPNTAKDQDDDGDWDCLETENFACAQESGEKQFQNALELIPATRPISSQQIIYRHKFFDFSNIEISSVAKSEDETARTCDAGIGISMLAGSAEDGPGVGREGVHCDNGGFLVRRLCGAFKRSCQGRKPVVLKVGSFRPPMTPQILPNQLFVLGDLALAGVPAEFTTMSGRRLRAGLEATLASKGVNEVIVVGYANAYSQYVTTREEYQMQYYEGASTLFGEYTLAAYQQNFNELAESIVNGTPLSSELEPYLADDMPNDAEIESGEDRVESGAEYGDIIKDTADEYAAGQLVQLSYHCALPNHNMRLEDSFLQVEKKLAEGWSRLYADDHWSTKYHWQRKGRARSQCRVEWQIPENQSPGQYRIVVYGDALVDGKLLPFRSLSRTFYVR